jgi:hypothetical protein
MPIPPRRAASPRRRTELLVRFEPFAPTNSETIVGRNYGKELAALEGGDIALSLILTPGVGAAGLSTLP